jgi:hypothetical protein
VVERDGAVTDLDLTSPLWHAVPEAEAGQRLAVDPSAGLPSSEAVRRQERDGPNRLAEARREPRWKAFLRQFKEMLIIILVIATVVSLVVTREWETAVVASELAASRVRGHGHRDAHRDSRIAGLLPEAEPEPRISSPVPTSCTRSVADGAVADEPANGWLTRAGQPPPCRAVRAAAAAASGRLRQFYRLPRSGNSNFSVRLSLM